nr:Holliday junction resolvase RuvX [Buchnera aphidicola]
MLIIAFDYGIKNIGIAISETKLLYAQPICTIKNKNWLEIDKIIKIWLPLLIIVGYPIDMNGKKQKITKKKLINFVIN